jgi:hypothetical protein
MYDGMDSKGKGIAKYKEEDPEEAKIKELNATEEMLFGDETKISDALGLGMGVVVPENKLLTKSKERDNGGKS